MRIAFFTDTYLPNIDGVVTSIINTRAELQKRGHEVYVFCSGTRQDAQSNTDRQAFYHSSATFPPYPQYKVAVFPFFSSSRAKGLGVEMVHSHGLATMGLASVNCARRLKCPSVATFHTLVTAATHYVSREKYIASLASGAIWKYLKWYFGMFDATIAPSETARKLLAEHGIRAKVIPTGIDTEKFAHPTDPSGWRKRLGIGKRPVVLHFGRVALEKNLDLLIDASVLVKEKHPDCAFLIAGAGPDLERIRHRVEKLGMQKSFFFTGFLSKRQVADTFAISDVMAVPSTFETQGLAALEAMSGGVPVIAIRDTAVAEAIEEGRNGFLSGNEKGEFAERIAGCIGKRKKFERSARKHAEKCSLGKSAEKLEKLYFSLLEGR